MAAQKEANRILIFEAIITSGSAKAKLVMKMLIVKPMPPKSDIPIMCCQFKSDERLANPILTARKEIRNMPINLPAMSPAIIPIEFGVIRLLLMFCGNSIAVLANANSGRIKNAAG